MPTIHMTLVLCCEQEETLFSHLLQETITGPAGVPAGRAADQGKCNSLTAHMQAAPQHYSKTAC